MNKTFKVIFNKARGSFMVVNELTSAIQKKGTRTVVAVAVVSALSSGVAGAADYSLTEGNSGYSSTTAQETQKVFNDSLNMSITGENTQAYGLLASGNGHSYVNKGTISLNNASENAAKYWKVKGMMADQGGTAINESLIEVSNAYGMTVGSSKGDGESNTIINKGTINVSSGVGMEAAPTGVSGTVGTARAIAQNSGVINVTNGTAILVSGDEGLITNDNTINAANQYAVMVQKEEGKSAKNNVINFTENSTTVGNILVGAGVEGTELNFEDGATFSGRILVNNGTKTKVSAFFDVNDQILKGGNGAGAVFFIGDAHSSLTLHGSTFANNSVVDSDDVYGGVIYSYGSPLNIEDATFTGNSVHSTGANVNQNGLVQTGSGGGAVMIKGSPNTVFKDTLFTNNSAISLKTEGTTGGYAIGGAISVDYSTGNATDVERDSDVTFKITKNLTYFGNTVSSDSTAESFDTYGYHLTSATAGGFLFLDRGSDAVFDIDEGATLTIGQGVTTDDTDSIASSIPNTGTKNNDGKHASITKVGAGNLVINSSLNKYYGTVDVEAGRLSVNSDWNIKNTATVDSGAQLALASFSIADAASSGNQNVNGEAIGGKLVISGTLETSSAQVFTKSLDAEATVTDAEALKYTADQVTFNEGATLGITDAQYNLAYAQSAGDLLANAKVVMLGDLVGEVDNTVTLEEIENVGANVELNEVTVDAEDKNVQIGGTQQSFDVAYREESLSVGAIDLGKANTVTVTGGKELSLAGNGAEIISTSSEEPVHVNVEENSSLNLGGQYAQGGQISGKVTTAENSTINVRGNQEFVIDTITGSGTVNVGSDNVAGNLTVNSLEGMTGIIFVDPAWKEGTNNIADASYFGYTGNETLTVGLVSGRNAVVGFGGTKADATSAFEKIASVNDLSWGPDGITSAFYTATTVDLGTMGGVLVDGSLTAAPASVANALTVNKQGMLIVDQSKLSGPAVKGNIVLNDGSYLGISNASISTLTLASGEVTDNGTSVVTDNPFIEAKIDGNKVVGSYDVDNGLSALASAGIQAMTRRADMMLAQSIADRTSIDQDFAQGANLWVDVSGESYDADHLDHGGNFETDMGYGAFGADFALTDTITAGGAIQYGAGSLNSSVSSIKNDIKNYGVAFYAAKSFGPTKLVGELAYVQSDNDISSSQAAMNQSVDAKIYSAGVRAQYQLTAGAFQFVPSVGVRVSKLKTDAMDIGTVKVDDQDQTLVQVPIALRINAFEQNANGWSFAPTMRVAYIPTFGDKEIEVFNHEQDVIDTSPVQADFGLRARNGNLLLNAQMTVGGGEDGASSIGGKVGVKYMF